MQAWWTRHRQHEMKDSERETLTALDRTLDAADGCVAFAFGPSALIEDLAPAPPAILMAESRAAGGALFSERLRALRDRLAGTEKARERPGPGEWKIEETDGSQLAFQSRNVALSFQLSVFKELFKGLQVPPRASLEPLARRARSLLADADLTCVVARDGLKELAASGFVFEEDQVKNFDAWGFGPGSTLEGALKLSAQGVEERHHLRLAGPDSLLAVLANLPPLAPAAAEVVGEEAAPEALELLPPQTMVWLSLRGNPGDHATGLSKTVLKAVPGLAARLEAFEKLSGTTLAEYLAQVQAPVEAGLFFKLPGEELPDGPSMDLLVSAVLKDAKVFEAALEKLATTPEAFVGKEAVQGGVFYFVKDKPAKPGCWIKGSRCVYASWSEGLELALAALEHKHGTERLTDRPDIRRLLAANAIQPRKTLTAYADAAQFLELPYGLARILWGSDDPRNRWPGFAALAPQFGRILIQYGPAEGHAPEKPVAELHAETPFSLVGLLQTIRLPFEEAGW